MIHPHLATDGAIHLREQRRRHLHDGDAAEVGRGGKAGDVAGHATADRNDRARAIRASADERVIDPPDRRQLLVALAVGQQDRLFVSDASKLIAVESPHRLARYDETACGHARGIQDRAQASGRSGIDFDRVTAGGCTH